MFLRATSNRNSVCKSEGDSSRDIDIVERFFHEALEEGSLARTGSTIDIAQQDVGRWGFGFRVGGSVGELKGVCRTLAAQVRKVTESGCVVQEGEHVPQSQEPAQGDAAPGIGDGILRERFGPGEARGGGK